MSHSASKPASSVAHCAACGAENFAYAKSCWMCHTPLTARSATSAPEIVMAELVPDTPSRMGPAEWLYAAIFAIILVMLGLMGIGIAIDEPAMLIGYFILIGPAIIATLVRVTRKQSTGQRVGWGERLLTFLLSGVLTLALVAVLAIAAFLVFFVYCIYAITTMH